MVAAGQGKRLVLFNLVKQARNPEVVNKQSWQLLGRNVCREAYMEAIGVSNRKLARLERALNAGRLEAFEDQRKYNRSNGRHVQNQLQCDSFLSYAYSQIAEPLADANCACEELVAHGQADLIIEWTQARDGSTLAQAAAGLSRTVDMRWLPHMSWLDFYGLFEVHCLATEDSEVAGKACFLAEYLKRWTDKL